MKKLFLILAAMLVPSLLLAQTTAPINTITIMPWDLQQNPSLIKELKAKGFNHATVYVPWLEVEAEKGKYNFTKPQALLDQITKEGLSLIILLDFGGRPYFNHKGELTQETVIPSWARKDQVRGFSKDFSGASTAQISFIDPSIQEHTSRFVEKATAYLSNRYKKKITGFALGLQEEHEIKYGQRGYSWRDHGPDAQTKFQKQYSAPLPIINYNNEVGQLQPRLEPLLMPYMRFREDRLREAVCHYSRLIRKHGQLTMGYFAETFTSHDAIYATGIIEEVVDCIDIAIVDFNFYDGYSLKPEPYILPLLANYMASLGYRKIMVGGYAEQWVIARKVQALQPVLQETLALASRQPYVVGYEVGGLQNKEVMSLSASIDVAGLPDLSSLKHQEPVSSKKYRVGLLGSKTNFYLWHGERSNNRNVHQDALIETFKLLNQHPDIDVQVIGEKNLNASDKLVPQLNAIFIPHQIALQPETKAFLQAYWKNGGILMQDMRAGEFDHRGQPTGDWMHNIFGIAHVEWRKTVGAFNLYGNTLRLTPSTKLYTHYASMVPRPGYTLMAPDKNRPKQGLIISGERSLVFGFLPQLVDDASRPLWVAAFLDQITQKLSTSSVRSH